VCLVLDLVPKSITWSYQYALGLVILLVPDSNLSLGGKIADWL